MRLLLLEDDPIFGDGLKDLLQMEGHLVCWCRSLAEVRPFLDQVFDVWLWDWRLPDGSAIELLQASRKRGLDVPAIVLTARDALADRVYGLDCGADDFLVKPFDIEELAARLRVIARRLHGRTNRIVIKDVEVDLGIRQVWREGHVVDLTAREWRLLEVFLQRLGRCVSRDDLESLIHGTDNDLSSNSIEVHVFRLRQKLGRSVIETIRGRGYRIPRTGQDD